MRGDTRFGQRVQEDRPRDGRGRVRRRAAGPRPVRPAVAPVAVRPAQPMPPARTDAAVRRGPRLLVRRPVPVTARVALVYRVRRAVAGVALALVAALVVVGLGLLADAVTASRAAEVDAGEATAERTVTAGSLTTVPGRPGLVLRVPSG